MRKMLVHVAVPSPDLYEIVTTIYKNAFGNLLFSADSDVCQPQVSA